MAKILFEITLVVGLITLLGHGIWVVLAAILRALSGIGRDSEVNGYPCPSCGNATGLKQGVCQTCAYRTVAARRTELEQTAALIHRLHGAGRIADQDMRSVLQALQAEAASLHTASGLDAQHTAPLSPSQGSEPATAAAGALVPPEPQAAAATAARPPQLSPAAESGITAAEAPPLEILDEDVLDAEIVDAAPPPLSRSGTAPAVPAPHPLDAPEPEPEPAAAAAFSPRRTFANVLQTFMEEKNIRWGELASGMLIVGSAIGLVVSLRVQLQQLSDRIPYFPALLMMAGTVAIHAAGLYTLKRWKLRSTSRGVLIIATLLVPLSFAAGILLSGSGAERPAVGSPFYLAAVVVGLLGYGGITSLSCRALYPEGWWRLTVGVIGASAGQLIINRLAEDPNSTTLWFATMLFALPLASYLIATLSQLGVISAKQHLTPVRAGQTFTVLGVASFALAVPLVMQAITSASVRSTISALSPSLSIAAAVILSLGIAVQRRCESKRMGETRTAGTALALLGGMLMLGALVAAWPAPLTLMAVTFVTAAILAILAVVGRLPILHAGVVAAASFAGLLLFHHATGRFTDQESPGSMDVIRALLMGRSSLVLMIPASLSGLLGLLLLKKRRPAEGQVYLFSAAGVATIATLVAVYAGFFTGVDADWTTLIFVLYAVAAMACVPLVRRDVVSGASSAAVLVALIHLFNFNDWFAGRLETWNVSPAHPLILAVLLHGLLVAMYGLFLRVRRLPAATTTTTVSAAIRGWLSILPLSGAVTAAVTIPFVLYVGTDALGEHGAYAACIAAIWAIAAGVIRDPQLATAAHAAATVAIAFVTAAIARDQQWPDGLRDIRHWQLQLSVLGIWCLLATAARLATRRWAGVQAMLRPKWPSVDQVVLGALAVALIYVGLTGCWTGASVELGNLDAAGPAAQDSWHQVAYGTGSWIALGCAVAAILLLLYEQVTVVRLAALVLISSTAAMLLSGQFEATHAVASALRWSFAIFALLWIVAITLREPLGRLVGRVIPSITAAPALAARGARDVATLCGVLPVTVLTSVAVLQASQGVTFQGPDPESLFGGMHETVLYATPLALLVVGLLVIAVRDASTVFAFIGSLLLQYFVALSVMLPALKQGVWSTEATVSLVQWSACSLGGYALVWALCSRWIDRHMPENENWLYMLQLVAAAAASLILAGWSLGAIFLNPAQVDSVVDDLGNWPSYLAAGLAAGVLLWSFRRETRELAMLGVIVPGLFVTLAAATVNRWDQGNPGDWLAYHVVTAGYLAIALGAMGVAWWRKQALGTAPWLTHLSRTATVAALSVFLLLMRGCVSDPLAAPWTIGIGAGLFVFFAGQAIHTRKQVHTYLSAIPGVFATSVAWCHWSGANDEQFLAGLTHANVIVASLIGLFWLMLEIRHQSERGETFIADSLMAPAHALLAIASTLAMLLVGAGGAALSLVIGLVADRSGLSITDAWGLAALVTLGLLLIGLLWERRVGLSLVASYLWGYIAIALVLNLLQQTLVWASPRDGASWLVVSAGLAGAAYIALTGHVWKWGANVAQWAARLQVPHPVAKLEYISRWLPAFNLITAFVICGLGFVTIFTAGERAMRVAVAFAPLLLAYGMSCLAQQQRRFAMQCLTLFLLVIGGVFIGWADVSIPAGDAGVLAYCARLLVVLAGMTLLYSLLVTRWIGVASGWFEAVRRSGVVLAVVTIVVLAMVLVLEVSLFETGKGAPIATPEVVAISIMLFGFLAALLVMAVLPGRDPLGLSEKGRQGYVYAAQAMAALLFAHIYLAKPQLFQFGIMDYWPYIVMAIAFASVAFAEFCYRKGWQVIAEPMQRTGGFLPLLPALTAWAFSDPQEVSYPLTLFFAGLIYVFMSVSRRSVVAGIAAAVMGNGALWALFHDQNWSLAEQPQLWMIPPALSVLGASYINRDRLSPNSLTAIRYICVMIIYLSSTGEMFMKLMGVGEDVTTVDRWIRPMILTCLSVAGIFAGIMLRVRAFLYLGTSFLLMSIVGMVWNAQRAAEHVWPWWVFGISMGVFILVIFGLFEKHRQEVHQLIGRLRQWEP